MRASLLGMYLVQAVAFGAKRLAQRRGVALRSTAAYDALTKELREVARLEEVSGILSYDEQCFMSEGSAASRAAQKEALAGVIHEKRTSTRMAEVIDAARGLTLADAREQANVRDAIEGFDVESRKSKDLAEREARLESECFVAWKKAREGSDFPGYAPILQDMFSLKREVAATTRPDVCAAGEPYDGALDAFERGMTASRLDSIFAATREGLEPLLKAVLAKKRDAPEIDALHPALAFDHPGWARSVEKQAELSKRVAADLGFDFTKGRFDVSTFAAVHKSLRLRH